MVRGPERGCVRRVAVRIDRDGLSDLAYGSEPIDPQWKGRAVLFYGPQAGTFQLADADAVLLGAPFDVVGDQVDSAGDIDGDGATDLGVAAPQIVAFTAYGDGRVHVWTSVPAGQQDLTTAEIQILGEFPSFFANEITGGGDVDGDGHEDLLIGATHSPTGGHVYLIHGPVAPGTYDVRDVASLRFDGTLSNVVGASISFAGDLDADGTDDFVVGAPSNTAYGAMYVFQGPW